MAGEHAILPPSGANRWGNCAGSVALCRQFPEPPDSPEAMEGNAAHWIAATVLNDMCQFGQARAIKPGMSAPNGVLITEEMMEAVEVFTDTVIDEFGTDCFPITAQSLTRLQVEQRLEITNVHPQNWGTPDVFWAVVNPGKAAYVDLWDYKHGHRFVDAFENLQLVDYVAGILNDPAVAGIDPANIKLTLGIVQPRNFHPLGPVRRWTLTAAELAPYVERLRIASHAAMGNDPKTVVGDWCRDCSGRRGCVALQRAADAAMDLAESAAAQDLPPAALGTELRMIHRAQKLLDARATGLEEHAASLLKSGTAVPFYEINQTVGREAWTVTPEEVFALGSVFALDLRKQQAITPAQARKAGVPAEVVAGMITRPAGALKLEQVNTTQARKVFGK